jgi:multicomponent Na+:H+ antiporter subunit E
MRSALTIVLHPWRLAWFLARYLVELLQANAIVAWEVLTPTHYARPGIVACPIGEHSDLELTFIANLVSFTPGTLTIDISGDRSLLFVHALHIHEPEDVRAHVRRLEERLRWMLR